MAFDHPCVAVKRALKKRSKSPTIGGGHNAIPDDAEAEILAWIRYQAEHSQLSTKTNVCHHSAGAFRKQSLVGGLMDSFLVQHKAYLGETTPNKTRAHKSQVIPMLASPGAGESRGRPCGHPDKSFPGIRDNGQLNVRSEMTRARKWRSIYLNQRYSKCSLGRAA
jgi:hypothetical protein